MIKVAAITVARAEGPTDLCGEITVTDWKQAELVVRMNASTAPEGGAYDKTDITINYEDGFEYRTRLDVKAEMMDELDSLETHIRESIEGIKSERYQALVAEHRGEEVAREMAESAESFLETYQIGA
jgi:hypothetical protein